VYPVVAEGDKGLRECWPDLSGSCSSLEVASKNSLIAFAPLGVRRPRSFDVAAWFAGLANSDATPGLPMELRPSL
jgi:hypothetical protein